MRSAAFPEPVPRRGLSRVYAALAALCLATLGIGTVQTLGPVETPTAQAAETELIEVEVESFEPALPARDGELTISGTLTNTSDSAIANVRPYLWRNQGPLTNRASLDPVLEGTLPSEGRVFVDGAFENVTDDRGPMQPGEELPFTVTAKIEDLDLPRASGVYPVGVDVLGQVDNGAVSVPGQTRLLLPLPAEGATEPEPSKITSVVMFNAEPTMYAPGQFVNDDLAAEVSRGGRLATLLETARTEGISWAIDPSLYDELTAMAQGYQVRDEQGNLTEGTGSAVAARWLADFDALNDSVGFRLPYAGVDAEAAIVNEQPELIDRAAELGATSDLGGLPVLEWFDDGMIDLDTLEATTGLDPTVVLTSNADSAHRLLQSPADTEAPLVRYDPLAYAGGPEGTSDAHRRQRLLAESYIDARSQPSGGGTVRVITTAEQARADVAAEAPWVERLSLTELLGTDPNEWSETFSGSTSEPLTPEQLELMAGIEERSDSYIGAQSDPEDSAQSITHALARASSTTWRGRAEAQAEFLAPVQARIEAFFGGDELSLEATSRVTMDDQQGLFPVTISSQLDEPVNVAVIFTSSNDARLSIPDTEVVRVPPGESVTVDARPKAATNGTVPVVAHLVTPDRTEIGPGVEIEVQATRLGAVGWVIVAVSGVVLVVSTLLRIRQVRRHGKAPAETATDDDPVPTETTSAPSGAAR